MGIDEIKKQKAIEIATAVINGTVNPIEGCRQLWHMKYDIGMENDENFNLFTAVDSETDHLPLGSQKDQCSTSYLERVQREERQYLESARDDIVQACKEIIRKLN